MYDVYKAVSFKSKSLNQAEMDSISNWISDNKAYQEPAQRYLNLQGIIKDKNIFMIQVESLENILIGNNYFGNEITPNINKLLDESIYFSNVHEQVKDGNSSDAELLSLTSLYPLSQGSAFLRYDDNIYVSLPNLLSERAYTSIAIHGDDKEFWNRDNVFDNFGFDSYITEEVFEDKTMCNMGIADSALFSQAVLETEKLASPYFMFIITLTSHIPFKLDEDMQYLNLSDDNVTADYLQSMHYVDKAFGDFYGQLEANNLIEDSVIILYGDHQGIHKYFETSLPDNNYEIPFIVYIPGIDGFEMKTNGGEVDIMPTIAYLLGLEHTLYEDSVMGKNLFNDASDAVILPTDEIIGSSDDAYKEHLKSAGNIADLIIKGNYLSVIDKQD